MHALALLVVVAGIVPASSNTTPRDPHRLRIKLEKTIKPWLGTPYRYGHEERRRGTDCSGFTSAIAWEAFRVELPRSSRDQRRVGERVKRAQLRPGDLVFFSMGGKKGVNHVGIYMGGGKVAHASRSRGVVYDDLDDYRKEYRTARRVFGKLAGSRGL
jgi:cell wall-associated NlpC family hydrolase